jgi:hypothetical protein
MDFHSNQLAAIVSHAPLPVAEISEENIHPGFAAKGESMFSAQRSNDVLINAWLMGKNFTA